MAQDKSTKEAVKVSRVSKSGVKPEKPAAKPDPKAQAKTNAKPESRAAKRAKAEPPPPPKPSPVERYSVKPEFWDGVFDSMPPWLDEIASILLIVFGIVSFLSLIDVSGDATIAAAWSRALTSLFGWGSILISAGIFALGVILILPKLGITLRFPTRRILALEIMFLSVLALLHLFTGETELRAVARAGEGGGQVGWALSSLVANLFGTIIAIIAYAVLFLLAFGAVAGIRSMQVKTVLERGSASLLSLGETMQERAKAARASRRMSFNTPAPDPLGDALAGRLGPTEPRRMPPSPIYRIRPDIESLPPSMRPGAQTGNDIVEADPDDFAHATTTEHPLFTRRETPAPAFNLIGTPIAPSGKKNKGILMVERPDGRMKRYFPVEGMKEAKHSSRRNAQLPPLDLLRDIELNLPDEAEINNNVVLIENTLLEFDIDVDVVDVKVGPTVTQYAVQPFREAQGDDGEVVHVNRTRINKIAGLQNDLALSLSAKRLRMETPVPGTSYIGIEVPNRYPSTVALRSVIESRAYHDLVGKDSTPLTVPLGRDVAGRPFAVDLAKMPHVLIAGTTGSGKSVAIAAIATALLLSNMPDQVKLVLLDPKMVELSRFNGVPHLLGPVETDLERIVGVLRWCTREMDRRYRLLEEHSARNIDIYNSRLGRRRKEDYLPYIVIIIDEVGDLMLSRPDETEKTITRLAQMARAVGMHLIVATQRPSVDVITGLIKANFPSRISFAVATSTDSRVILDSVGAENLMGRGDMLFHASDAAAPRRIQGCFVSDDEVRAVVDHWRQWHKQQVESGKTQDVGIGPWERALTRRDFLSETDPALEQAITLVAAEGEASASLIQRRLGLGYPRAARIMDLLEQLGIIEEAKPGQRSREVLIKPGTDPFKDLIERRMNAGSAEEVEGNN